MADEAQRYWLSFGFLTVDSHDDDGVRVLDEVDLFEITLTPSPANADTRITEMNPSLTRCRVSTSSRPVSTERPRT